MNKTLIPLLLTLTAIASPAHAGLHDFDPSTPSRSQLGKGTGECYSTKDGSKVCYLRLDVREYSVAIYSSETGSHPQALYVNCNTEFYQGYGGLNEGQSRTWANAICRDND